MSIEAVSWALNYQDLPLDKRTGRMASAAKLVLIALANHASPDGCDAFPAVATIVRYTGLSERAVQYTLAALVEHGTIAPTPNPLRRDQRINQANHRPESYDLVAMTRGANPAPLGVQSRGVRGAKSGVEFAPEPSLEPTTRTKTSKPANAGLADASSAGSPDDDAPPLLAGLEPPANGHRPRARKPRTPGNAGAAGGDEAGVTAQQVTAQWVDAYREAHQGVEPTRSLIGRVSRCAKELLTAGNDPERVVRAAQSAGRQGWATIDRELARLASGSTTNGARGHVPYKDPEDMSVYTTEIR